MGSVLAPQPAHIWQVGEAYGQVLLRDFVMDIRDYKLVAGWRIWI